MVTTNVIKWDNTDHRLTAFCSDDTGETEIGPCKWDNTNHRLEINCNSVDATVKWDDTGHNLESRTTDDGCCEDGYVEGACCNDGTNRQPEYFRVVISDVDTDVWPIQCQECRDEVNGTFILPLYDNCVWFLETICDANESLIVFVGYDTFNDQWDIGMVSGDWNTLCECRVIGASVNVDDEDRCGDFPFSDLPNQLPDCIPDCSAFDVFYSDFWNYCIGGGTITVSVV